MRNKRRDKLGENSQLTEFPFPRARRPSLVIEVATSREEQPAEEQRPIASVLHGT